MLLRREKSPQAIAKEMAQEGEVPYDERLQLLRQSTGVKEEHVKEYQKSEVIRNAIAGVRRAAAVHQAARTSPNKLYKGVKSKVARNVKTVNRTQR